MSETNKLVCDILSQSPWDIGPSSGPDGEKDSVDSKGILLVKDLAGGLSGVRRHHSRINTAPERVPGTVGWRINPKKRYSDTGNRTSV